MMLEIVKAGREHIEGILEIWNELMLLHEKLDRSFETVDEAREIYWIFLETNLKNEDFLTLAALEGGIVTGYAVSCINTEPRLFRLMPRGEIIDIAVRSGYRGKGTGKAILEEIKKWFTEKGISRIELHAAAGNERGLEFWRKSGFRPLLYRMYLDIPGIEERD